MKKRKRTEIVIEREQVFVIRKLDDSARQFCPQCGDEAQMTSVDEAGAVARLTARAIYKQVEAQQAHFLETPDGKLLICLRSLVEASQDVESPPDQRQSDKLEIEHKEDRTHENQEIF